MPSKLVNTMLKVLKMHQNIVTFSTFKGILAGPSADNFKLFPVHYKIPLDVHVTTGYKQGSLFERPSGVTASAKARSCDCEFPLSKKYGEPQRRKLRSCSLSPKS